MNIVVTTDSRESKPTEGDAAEWADVYTKIFPAYQLLIESYTKAQEVVKNNELLDSQRA